MNTFFKIFVFLILGICIFTQNSNAQRITITTEDYKIDKTQCKSYLDDLFSYLKSKGLYEGLKFERNEKGKLSEAKKKLIIEGIDFASDYVFIKEVLGFEEIDEQLKYCGDFGVIEVGFGSREKAAEVFQKAVAASKKNSMNIRLYIPPFKCVLVEKNVLFVYSINVFFDKYRNMAEGWTPGKK